MSQKDSYNRKKRFEFHDRSFFNRIKNSILLFKDPDLFEKDVVSRVLMEAGKEYLKQPDRWQRVKDVTYEAMGMAQLESGSMLEIGGRRNPRNESFPDFKYSAMDLQFVDDSPVHVTAGDITNCPEIPDESFDLIFSFDVFEHIDKPWLAGQEIQRLLRPGGVTVHSTLFAWRYHPCPIDYWRYSPEGLASLFPALERLICRFDYTERRRDVNGRGRSHLEPDLFGAFRENIRVHYAGQKPMKNK
ncbi:hypothetical protein FIV00_27875 [Labrenzia sp. THAF82]|uniref:class I SAM-dependent methyltransferase n=1 Tax=Labrenzia sp. THAF82 TaxID=2587861 RepID=UPI001268707C|nr:class I SAM-dependent methyltransferase [Labrenzia sp. THAF82]QFT34345.1 hypothetical protein FIV00_27875 [Labrenzia sp. THAF82]